MKMTIVQAFEMIGRGETPEEYEKRIKKIKRLSTERDFLEDAICFLDPDDPRAIKKRARLAKVLTMLNELS